MLHLANPNQAPPGSFRVRLPQLALINPQLALVGPYHALKDMEDEVTRRCKANGVTPPTDAELQDLLCQSLPPGHCRDELNQPTIDAGSMSLTLADVAQGTGTLITWWRNGRRRVSDDEIVRRSYLCNQCPMHRQITGCQGCSGAPLRAIINEVVGGRSLPTDGMLGACGVCKCSLVSKTRLHLSDILPHMSTHQMDNLWEKCWLKEPTTPTNQL